MLQKIELLIVSTKLGSIVAWVAVSSSNMPTYGALVSPYWLCPVAAAVWQKFLTKRRPVSVKYHLLQPLTTEF